MLELPLGGAGKNGLPPTPGVSWLPPGSHPASTCLGGRGSGLERQASKQRPSSGWMRSMGGVSGRPETTLGWEEKAPINSCPVRLSTKFLSPRLSRSSSRATTKWDRFHGKAEGSADPALVSG